MQVQKTVNSNVVVPATGGVGCAQPSLGLLSCRTCSIRGGCFIEQLTPIHEHVYQVMKNRKDVSKGAHIFRSGDAVKSIFIVTSGSVKSYILMENGEEQVLNFFMPGEVFGLEAMASDCHISSAVTLEATRICKLSLTDLQDRALGQGFLNLISKSLLREHNLTMMLARKDANARLASFLVEMSKRTNSAAQSVDVIKLTMTRRDIANYLGMALETVCRTLRRFQDSGMLKVRRRTVDVHDYACLLRIAGTQLTG